MPLRPLLALLALAATWGGSYLLIAVALRSTTPATLTLARFLPAAVLMLLLAAARGHLRGLRFPEVPRLGLLAAVLTCSPLVPPVLLDPPTRMPTLEGVLAMAVLGLVGTGLAFGRRSKAGPGVPVTVPPQAGPVVPAARATS